MGEPDRYRNREDWVHQMSNDLNQVAYARGDRHFKGGRFREAAREFAIALAEWPEDWMAMHALSNSYSEMKKPRKAEKWLRQAIDLAPATEQAALLYCLGNALFDQQRYADAIEIWRQVPRGDAISRLVANNIALAERRSTTAF